MEVTTQRVHQEYNANGNADSPFWEMHKEIQMQTSTRCTRHGRLLASAFGQLEMILQGFAKNAIDTCFFFLRLQIWQGELYLGSQLQFCNDDNFSVDVETRMTVDEFMD